MRGAAIVRGVRRHLQILLALLALVAAVAFAAGCGDEDDPAPSDDPPPAESAGEPDPPPDPAEAGPTQADLTAAGVDPVTGIFQGLELDTRRGTPPRQTGPAGLKAAAAAAGCTLRLGLRDEGNDHLEPGDPEPRYGTNPPTSGPHDLSPLADGAYRETPPAVNSVHSLEHGRIAIQYDPALPEAQQLLLKGVFDADPDGIVMFPNPQMPFDVAVTAWGDLMGCEQVADPAAVAAAVVAFRNRFRGEGPEAVPL